MLVARERRIAIGRRTGRDEDHLRGHQAAIAEAHLVRAFERGAGLDQLGPGALEIADIGRVQRVDHPVLAGDEGRPVEARRLGQRPAEAAGVLELLGEARGIDEQLLGHAAADDAGAADAVRLGHHHLRAMLRGDAARRARRPSPPRSRTGRRRNRPCRAPVGSSEREIGGWGGIANGGGGFAPFRWSPRTCSGFHDAALPALKPLASRLVSRWTPAQGRGDYCEPLAGEVFITQWEPHASFKNQTHIRNDVPLV
jgi:hypothetical protein